MSEPKNILLTVDGELREVTHGTTGLDLFREKPTTAVMRVDGLLWDLAREIPAGASVESVDITEPEGLEVLRHSTAHVMAQAVQQLRPGAKLGIGPYITDGFYFDFDVDEPFAEKVMTSADRRLAAASKEVRVRVESSKNRLTTVRPRSAGRVLISRCWVAAMRSATSSRATAPLRPRSAVESRCLIPGPPAPRPR